jgi:hypothetical protein
MRTRGGFTVSELFATVFAAIVLAGATSSVLTANQRARASNNEKTRVRQILRTGSDLLFTELREVSAAGGDILGIGDAALHIRVMRSFGLACDVSGITRSTPSTDVLNRGQGFAVGDSVVIFADNAETVTTDDVWIRARVSSVEGGLTCGDDPALGAQRLHFSGQQARFVRDAVREGAPIRSFSEVTYGLVEYGGRWFVGRDAPGPGGPTPLVGPLNGPDAPRPGLTFRYLDGAGNATTVLADIVQLEVALRAREEATHPHGGVVNDSLVTRIHLRN